MNKYHYIKPELIDDFKLCINRNRDYYGKSIVDTAILVMKNLSKKMTPKQSWQSALEIHNEHSGMSAAMCAVIVSKYSPQGETFKQWCIKDDVVMVNWNE